ncbi:hypothetical protein [Limosilactobacillus reuteri]|uniref:hypothetical protein n=1 Tax=Limosilactobacillus reuteri TaxID=1598 RepID=UPI001E599A69|nr:hypothetical protein [Limosilactobacillus reuteri]MCC4373112.1 hypothetical protein [Limosilactobacillus reuteri]
MVELAFSEELKRKVSALEANKLSKSGQLQSKYSFHCLDQVCQIPLTCTNWCREGKRYYFKPSSNSKSHVDGCSMITSEEFKAQNEKDVNESKNTIKNGGYIIIDKYPGRSKTQSTAVPKANTLFQNQKNIKLRKKGINIAGVKKQNSHRSSMYSLIQLWKDKNILHNQNFLVLNGKNMSLNELFINLPNCARQVNGMHIFYGKAIITHKNDWPTCFKFCNFNRAILYGNYDYLKKRPATMTIDNYISSGKSVDVYFRGYLQEEGNKLKFLPFNEFLYQDIYIDD